MLQYGCSTAASLIIGRLRSVGEERPLTRGARRGAQLVGPLFCRADAALFEAAAGLDAAALRAGRTGARFALEETLAAGGAPAARAQSLCDPHVRNLSQCPQSPRDPRGDPEKIRSRRFSRISAIPKICAISAIPAISAISAPRQSHRRLPASSSLRRVPVTGLGLGCRGQGVQVRGGADGLRRRADSAAASCAVIPRGVGRDVREHMYIRKYLLRGVTRSSRFGSIRLRFREGCFSLRQAKRRADTGKPCAAADFGPGPAGSAVAYSLPASKPMRFRKGRFRLLQQLCGATQRICVYLLWHNYPSVRLYRGKACLMMQTVCTLYDAGYTIQDLLPTHLNTVARSSLILQLRRCDLYYAKFVHLKN